MTSEDLSGNPRKLIESALEEYSLAWFSGNPLDLDMFCRQYQDIEEELRKEIDEFLYVAGRLDHAVQTKSATLVEDKAEAIDVSGEILNDFRLIREIGRGGMGTVYEAEQISLHRRVALKVLSPHLSLSRDSVEKFKREAEAGGRQRHPGIVAVYAVGEHEGSHFLAQELVEEGKTLADRLDALRGKDSLPHGHFSESAQLMVEVAGAMHHAHETGVIHRDIKPSNLLITREGRPKITDFGLAKVEDALALSRTGEFAGTPYYMSPEQVSGHDQIDRRTDIYSLGVTLYEMLTLQKPFEGKSSYDVLKKIPHTEPGDPEKLNPRVPRDLSVICLKAMEKSPERRYRTMKEFGDDLQRYLSGEVIHAKPAGPVTRIMKKVKRNPLLSGAMGMAVLAMLALMVWGVVYFIQMKSRYDEVRRQSDLNLVYRLKAEADALWPAYPWKINDLERWLDKASALLGRDGDYRSEFNRLNSKDRLDAEETSLKKYLETLIWEIDGLGNEEKGLYMDVMARLHFAETILEESLGKHETAWEKAVVSIADVQECPQYKALNIEPVVGLVPIGRDPESGLWEFAHLQTGDIPERDTEERLVMIEEMGLVFVLIPGGTFHMGSVLPDEEHPEGTPNVDPDCDPVVESPINEVQIEPFFISKFEMTQGQWLRSAGSNPSTYCSSNWGLGTVFTLLHPVETVTWNDCFKTLGRLNLTMPHQAQWEYAYRAGSSTVFYTGNDFKTLEGHANIADDSFKNFERLNEYRECVEWNDGHAKTAPVGSFEANPFGLHDMAGNVSEWCGTRFVSKETGRLSSDDASRKMLGSYHPLFELPHQSRRGGSFASPTSRVRASCYTNVKPLMCDFKGGIRPAMRVENMTGFDTVPSASSTGTTWFVPDDFPGIQKGIEASTDGDTIVVKAGTYVENIDFLGKDIRVKSERGPGVTTLDGNKKGSVVIFRSGEGSDALLEGFTLTNGTGCLWEGITRGGGILCDQGSSPTIAANIISGNSAYYGGGICIREGSSPIIVNNIINANSAEHGGGAIQCNRYVSTITGNTICNNTAVIEGGGLRCAPRCDVTIVNSIFWNNHAPTGPEIYVGTGDNSFPSRLSISYSDVRGGEGSIHVDPNYTLRWGPGMVDADPLFVDPGKGDFHLTAQSPCKDMGDNSVVSDPTDYEGNPRITDGAVDMGADER